MRFIRPKPVPPPSSPTSLNALVISSTEIDLTWSGSGNTVSFTVHRSTDNSAFSIVGTTTVASLNDSGLSPGTQYFYYVTATNRGGTSQPSATVNATTQSAVAAPSAPTGLTATHVSASQINLAWTNTASNAAGNNILQSTDNVTFNQIASVSATATTFNSGGLLQGTQYWYKVQAFNSGGTANSNTATDTTSTPTNFPADVITLTNWKVTLPVDNSGTFSGTAREVNQPSGESIPTPYLSKFSNQYFNLGSDNISVVFHVPVNGAVTSDSTFPRSELWEMATLGAYQLLGNWSSSLATHTLEFLGYTNHIPTNGSATAKVVIAQVRSTASGQIIAVYVKDNGSGTKQIACSVQGVEQGTLLNSSYTYGTAYDIKIVVAANTIQVFYGGVLKITTSLTASDLYFKCGCWPQANAGTMPSTEYGESVLTSLTLTHVGNTYYLSLTGSDANNGDITHPFLTWAHALTKAVSGDTIKAFPGTYHSIVQPATSGKPSAPITLTSTTGVLGDVIIQNDPGTGTLGSNYGFDFGSNSPSYYIVKALEADNCDADGTKIGACTGVVFDTYRGHHNGWVAFTGSTHGGEGMITTSGTQFCTAINCRFDSNREHGFYLSNGSDNCCIDGCTMELNGDSTLSGGGRGSGFQCNTGSGATISSGNILRNCTLKNNVDHGIAFVAGFQNGYVHHNVCYGNNSAGTASGGSQCFIFGPGSANNHITNNTFIEDWPGVGSQLLRSITISPNSTTPSSGNIFYNNIYHNTGLSGGSQIPFEFDSTSLPFASDYNDFYNAAGTVMVQRTGTGSANYADLTAWRAATGLGSPWDAHSVKADPLFTNASTNDYTLQGGSPAKATGVPLDWTFTPTTGTAPNMGAL